MPVNPAIKKPDVALRDDFYPRAPRPAIFYSKAPCWLAAAHALLKTRRRGIACFKGMPDTV